ncbi:hypothetical protein [Acidipropionibacterium jensenii]|uniref:hypothetical protein n=1 Tax=Acidipropionibacterium jensenii TaxID=1749 RepID=UPI002648EA5B|nr:hypothetical protein [Acidipropionibacterium jensenii]MDN5996182.1 hypothetical protein [Acidipropionibacterium jensenii]
MTIEGWIPARPNCSEGSIRAMWPRTRTLAASVAHASPSVNRSWSVALHRVIPKGWSGPASSSGRTTVRESPSRLMTFWTVSAAPVPSPSRLHRCMVASLSDTEIACSTSSGSGEPVVIAAIAMGTLIVDQAVSWSTLPTLVAVEPVPATTI